MSLVFPETVDCFSKDTNIAGRYKLHMDATDVLLAFSEPLNTNRALVYEKMNCSGGFMIYCEGTAELLPGDIWEAVVSDALSRHAEANMSAVVSETNPGELLANVCKDIMHVAKEASKELVGWIIVSYKQNSLNVLARCVQRVEKESSSGNVESPLNPIGQPTLTRSVSQWSAFTWEVRRQPSSLAGVPDWLVDGLSSAWTSLVIQSGCFGKDNSVLIKALKRRPSSAITLNSSVLSNCSTMASPPSSPLVAAAKPMVENRIIVPECGALELVSGRQYVWDLRSCASGLERVSNKEAGGIESKRLKDVKGQFTLLLQPPAAGSQLIALTLCKNETAQDTIFSLCLGQAKSGQKKFAGNAPKFQVLFHPKAVHQPLKELTVTLEFFH